MITNVTKPVITGKGAAGDTVTLYDGTKAIGTAVVAAGGTWSVTPTSALAAGVHSLTATETARDAGTSASSAALKLTIKTSAPAPSGLSYAVAADKGGSGDTMTVAGKGEARDTVTLYDGTTAIGRRWWRPPGPGRSPRRARSRSARTALPPVRSTSPPTPAPLRRRRASRSTAPPQTTRWSLSAIAGIDDFTGGPGNDYFYFSVANLANERHRSRAAAAPIIW